MADEPTEADLLTEREAMIDEINDKITQAEADVAAGRVLSPEAARELLRVHLERLLAERT